MKNSEIIPAMHEGTEVPKLRVYIDGKDRLTIIQSGDIISLAPQQIKALLHILQIDMREVV